MGTMASCDPPHRIGSSGHQLEFDFVTDNSRCAVQILKLWNITLLESMGPEKLNEISSFLNTTKKSTHKKSSKSFRAKKNGDSNLRRTESLSKKDMLRTRRGMSSCCVVDMYYQVVTYTSLRTIGLGLVKHLQ